MNATFNYIQQQRQRFIDELAALLRFPSVSAQPAHRDDLRACAAWLRDHFQALGLDARVIPTSGHPLVRADYRAAGPHRLLIYGHYDVQPEDPLDRWQSPPFEPSVRDGYIYARGATDDKGQFFAHVKAVESLLRTRGDLPCSVTFLLEGEEESTGEALTEYIAANRDELGCSAVVVSDTALFDAATPAITYGLRGILPAELTVIGPAHDLHSGSYGGMVANPAVVLAQLLAACRDADGRVAVPGFYGDVEPLSERERAALEALPFDRDAFCRDLDIPADSGEPGFGPLARAWARPTFDVNGIVAGYGGKGMKTIIPSRATAKISMRLVPHQTPEAIFPRVERFLRARCPEGVRLEISHLPGARPVRFDTDHPAFARARQALQQGFGVEPVFIREGGSIPVVEVFARYLDAPVLLLGFGLRDDGAHAPNERFRLDNFIHGAQAATALLDQFA